MTTLERSSYSFRRQGSSGHIWDNKFAGGQPPATTAHGIESSQLGKVSNVEAKSVGMKTNENAYAAKPTSTSKSKPQKCSFIGIFGRCSKTPAS